MPERMGQLTALQKLSLMENQPSNLPESNGQLTALQKLGLQSGSAWAHPGPGGPPRAPPGPSPGTNPADGRRTWTSSRRCIRWALTVTSSTAYRRAVASLGGKRSVSRVQVNRLVLITVVRQLVVRTPV